MRVAILVPRREGFEDRDKLWQWCRKWWQWRHPEWPVVEGHHVRGLFNRSAAVNEAARLAGDWDVAVLIDSDVLLAPEAARAGVELAAGTGRMVVPFEWRYDLTPRGTSKVMAGYEGPWEPFVRRKYDHQNSSVVILPRRLWDDVGGFDEGFSGWGLEDTAYSMAAEVMMGAKIERMAGTVWHLYHKTAAEKHGSLPHSRNVARASLYRAAHATNDKAAIRALVEEGRQMEAARTADAIPRILHRVVPVQTPGVAEAWWVEFGDLHPGWRMMTHRDPLSSGDWPLTSPHWAKVKSGAQLADLVRLEALVKWGGVYVDQDVQPFRSLEPLLGAEVFAAWEDDKTIPNAVLGARPDHPLMRAMLERCIAKMPRGIWEAGPGATTAILRNAPEALLLPPGAFYDVHYNDPDRDSKMTAPAPPWAFVRHHYWGSWLEESRRRVPAA